jgi:division protein CdvB (Snf7/Vps24/ESCRT-III family)
LRFYVDQEWIHAKQHQEVIGGTAAVSQLLGQAITIIQKIQDARAKVRGASDRLDGYQSQLDTLLDALRLVQDEPELQTRPIEKQVQKIIDLGKGLQRQLDTFAAQLTRSKTKQYTHAIFSGDKDERELENAMTRLDRAKADLNAMIVTTQVGLSGSMRAGFEVALAVVQRVDMNVRRVLGERLCMAAHLEERRMGEEGIA